MSWLPERYLRFEAERARAAFDLIQAIPDTHPDTAIDLGCGPGNSTEILKKRFPDAAIEGLDSSAEMVAAARARLPSLTFTQGDIALWHAPKPQNIILANAALQWLPNHQTLLPRLVGALAERGSLAIQMPDNLDEPAHRLMRETALAFPKLAQAASHRENLKPADWYYRLLKPHTARVDIWRTTYHHVLPGGPSAIVEWFRSTGMRPFLAPLTPLEQTDFLADYTARLSPFYPPGEDGSVLLPFPRLFLVAST